MPAALRPTRSLAALAIVANLLAASIPGTAGAFQLAGDGGTSAARLASSVLGSHREREGANAAEAAAATRAYDASGDVTATAWSRSDALGPRPVGVAKAAQPAARPATSTGATTSRATSYKGRNHVWIPALGVNRSVSFYSCSSSYYPGNRVYRWGCAGSNNVYLFGHAHSVFKSLHDAYVRGRLSKGMKVYYANGAGRVSTYAVSWWRLTTPDKGGWAYAAQSSPSLTLQTCVGAQSQYRLIVRLRKVG